MASCVVSIVYANVVTIPSTDLTRHGPTKQVALNNGFNLVKKNNIMWSLMDLSKKHKLCNSHFR